MQTQRSQQSFRLDARERAALDREGYVCREKAFGKSELVEIADACEALIERLLEERRHPKVEAGAYVFEHLQALETAVKWEKDNREIVLGIEPFAHLSEPLDRCAHDSRLIDPMRDLLANDDLMLFTEKLNVKRGHVGGPIVLHQDYPYWVGVAEDADQVGTAIVFLDDSTIENGCLEVVPGSHRDGETRRKQIEGFGANEMDKNQYDESKLVPLEVPAGSVAYFNSFLVHRSLPNRSAQDRRALLYSYQPAGNPHAREIPRPFKLTDG
ncbi:MAG TPA: phytanoyl-CoA dioxygenase family protein [Candidatus Cybelea sp.]|nr:phytanoyl-CoA dioxygenase family protein [Candidatus Cybelea sp.]